VSAATVALEPAGPRISKRVPQDVYHLVASEPVKVGYIVCNPSEPLCGTTATLQSAPDGLFAPAVTCSACAAIAEREHIAVSSPESQP
jgi:hypothetical protein